MNVIPDTSVVIDGRLTERIEDGTFAGATISVPEPVVAELEAQANDGHESGWDGLEELNSLTEYAEAGEIELEYVGDRPTAIERGHADEGEIDAIIREYAQKMDGIFFTSDVVQAEVATAKGIEVEYVSPRVETVETLAIEEYFDEETMSVHLRSGSRPHAKRGGLGEMRYEAIEEAVLEESALKEMTTEIHNAARQSSEGFLELDEPGMTIVQFRNYRIALAEPPFADGYEITAVRPIAETELGEYEYADDLRDRLGEQERGVLISGSPGAGKSTFAQAVGSFLADSDYVVKTMEKPRDLQVGPEITQYAALDGEMEKTADALLMVRPDYTIYDEVRKTKDFEVFADMRMAGVGMIGVVHATRPIDALQRLIGRVELGLIPQIVDTVVYIEAGEVNTVYEVATEVKVPHGLTEEDLARPVIVIQDFETGEPAYEIYTFNRQVVTVPLEDDEGSEANPMAELAEGEIAREIERVAQGPVDVEAAGANKATVYVSKRDISQVIGKGGGQISDIENRLGVSIDVRTHEDRSGGRPSGGGQTGGSTSAGSQAGGGQAAGAGQVVTPDVTSRHVVLPAPDHAGETVEIRAGGEYLFTATVSRGGEVQVSRGSAIADELEQAIDRKQEISIHAA